MPSGRAMLSTLTTVAPALRQDLPAQRPGPHRGHVDDQQARRRTRRGPGTDPPHHGSGRRRLAEHGRRQAEQAGATDDLVDRAGGGPLLDRGPRVVARHVVAFDQGGYGVDVVGTRQRDGAPAVARGQQSGGPTRGDSTAAAQPELSGPPGEQRGGVQVDTDPSAEVGGDSARLGQHRGAGEVGRTVGHAGQERQPGRTPILRRRVHGPIVSEPPRRRRRSGR